MNFTEVSFYNKLKTCGLENKSSVNLINTINALI